MIKTKIISIAVITAMIISMFSILATVQTYAAKTSNTKTTSFSFGNFLNGNDTTKIQIIQGTSGKYKYENKTKNNGAKRNIKNTKKKINGKTYTFALQQQYNNYTSGSLKIIQPQNGYYKVEEDKVNSKICKYIAIIPNISGFNKKITKSNKRTPSCSKSTNITNVNLPKNGAVWNEKLHIRNGAQTANIKINTLTKKKIVLTYTLISNASDSNTEKVLIEKEKNKWVKCANNKTDKTQNILTIKCTYTKK